MRVDLPGVVPGSSPAIRLRLPICRPLWCAARGPGDTPRCRPTIQDIIRPATGRSRRGGEIIGIHQPGPRPERATGQQADIRLGPAAASYDHRQALPAGHLPASHVHAHLALGVDDQVAGQIDCDAVDGAGETERRPTIEADGRTGVGAAGHATRIEGDRGGDRHIGSRGR